MNGHQACAVVDLGFGDSGKGRLVDALAREHRTSLVVRHNGGPQAAHNVIEPGGRHHTFAQFGSGTLVGAATHMSRFTYVNPLSLIVEAKYLHDVGIKAPLDLWTADPRCYVVTPIHREVNRLREEARGLNRHGSCGVGFGEAVDYSLEWPTAAPQLGDLDDINLLLFKLHALQEWAVNQDVKYEPVDLTTLATTYVDIRRELRLEFDDDMIGLHRDLGGHIIFEGAQAVLIDQTHGFAPYHTWSDCTFANAETLCHEAGITPYRLGVTRSYMARHGAGPLPTESFGLKTILKERHNSYNKWQGEMRVGHLDLALLYYASWVCGGVNGVAVTHLDRTHALQLPVRPVATSAMWDEDLICLKRVDDTVQAISDAINAPVVYESWGPTYEDTKAATVV